MNIDTIGLQCFIAVVESKSFTKAAKRLKRTQSAVSQQIGKLESELGKSLLVRGKTLDLTPDGEIFFGYAKKIFSLHNEVIDRFKKPELEGEICFGLPEDFASLYLSEILVAFSRIHPRVLLKIECDLTLNLFERFKKNEFDLVLIKMNCPEDFPNGLDIWSESLKWVGDRNLIDKKNPVPLVLSPAPCVYRSSAIQALEHEHQKWRLVLSSSSYTSTVAAVRAGMGITIMPHAMIPNDMQAIHSPLLPPLPDAHVSMIKSRKNSPAVDTLAAFVMQKLKG
jgi:DNA-binding transcriptional LysR family regulator